MSSVRSRIVIEHYVNGGFGVFINQDFDNGEKDIMGLRYDDVMLEVMKWLKDKE